LNRSSKPNKSREICVAAGGAADKSGEGELENRVAISEWAVSNREGKGEEEEEEEEEESNEREGVAET